ncbi:MAG: orotidine 5'-phosphate decarboxylase [Candidatus Poribacteria bacterium]|nr:MAG: orotidine 5'-phosphate decarboxylase [Candidatus Poribacteria bacterium]
MSANRIIVALDLSDLDALKRLLDRLAGRAQRFKIGKELFTATGPASVELVHRYGGRVFLDLKFHDIPNTVAGAVRSAARLGVWMLNVHTMGGTAMMKAARAALGEEERRPLLLGVTVLTSLGPPEWAELVGPGGRPLEAQVAFLAERAIACGLDGVIASPQETASLRERLGERPLIVTPGVRPRWAARDDQARVLTPTEALRAGADYLVIGRPITAAGDPAAAMERLCEEIAGAKR